MLAAVTAMYQVTESVRYSSTRSYNRCTPRLPTSCLVFILYVDYLIERLKEIYADDGFLSCFIDIPVSSKKKKVSLMQH